MGYLDRPPEDGELDSTSQYLFYILTQEEARDLLYTDSTDDTQELESSSIERGVTTFNKEFIASTSTPGNRWINPFLKVPISLTPIEYQMDICDRLAPKHEYFGLFVRPKIREDSCPVVHLNPVLEDLRRQFNPVYTLGFTCDVHLAWKSVYVSWIPARAHSAISYAVLASSAIRIRQLDTQASLTQLDLVLDDISLESTHHLHISTQYIFSTKTMCTDVISFDVLAS
jgi:hypothetical protein